MKRGYSCYSAFFKWSIQKAIKQLAASTKIDTTDLEQMIRQRAMRIKSFTAYKS